MSTKVRHDQIVTVRLNGRLIGELKSLHDAINKQAQKGLRSNELLFSELLRECLWVGLNTIARGVYEKPKKGK